MSSVFQEGLANSWSFERLSAYQNDFVSCKRFVTCQVFKH